VVGEIKEHWIENIGIDSANIPTGIEISRLGLNSNEAPI